MLPQGKTLYPKLGMQQVAAHHVCQSFPFSPTEKHTFQSNKRKKKRKNRQCIMSLPKAYGSTGIKSKVLAVRIGKCVVFVLKY